MSSSSGRNIVVPQDIIAVPRRSPVKVRKRTPWDPAKTHVIVERGASREWFTDRLFVESKQANLAAACSTSAMVHVALVIVVLLLVVARAVPSRPTPRSLMDISLRMPPPELVLPATVAPRSERKHAARGSPVQSASPIARTLASSTAAPLETPSSVEPEPALVETEFNGATDGVAGGAGNGHAIEPAAPLAAAGPFRVGDGVDRPRKVKHVKPVYPLPAMAARVGGNVLIEATIGVDGRVHNARVLQSIPVLDQAALEAVRQWEFEPSRVNGAPVAVTMVIVVTFALL